LAWASGVNHYTEADKIVHLLEDGSIPIELSKAFLECLKSFVRLEPAAELAPNRGRPHRLIEIALFNRFPLRQGITEREQESRILWQDSGHIY
jgi:hypothetical protein